MPGSLISETEFMSFRIHNWKNIPVVSQKIANHKEKLIKTNKNKWYDYHLIVQYYNGNNLGYCATHRI